MKLSIISFFIVISSSLIGCLNDSNPTIYKTCMFIAGVFMFVFMFAVAKATGMIKEKEPKDSSKVSLQNQLPDSNI